MKEEQGKNRGGERNERAHTHTHTSMRAHTLSLRATAVVNVIMYTVYPLCEREVQMKGKRKREERVSPLQRGRWVHTASSCLFISIPALTPSDPSSRRF